MDFIEKEYLYTNGAIQVNGKKGFKYADIIIGCGEDYYHAVFFKLQNYFTIMMDDYSTVPTMEIASKVLTILCEADITGPDSAQIDKNRIKQLMEKLNSNEKYYKAGNFILRISDVPSPCKKAAFILNATIKIAEISACITSMSTSLEVFINSENKHNLEKYDKLFSVSVDEETVFRDLMCVRAYPDNDSVVLNFVTEQEYYMRHSQMNGVRIVGNSFWTMQVMEYTLNMGRDIPIEMRYNEHSLNVGKRRFFFIFSIKGLRIQNDVRFGLVTLSNESGINSDRESELNSIISEGHDCYAQIAVVNDSLRLAVEEAASMIDKAITLLQIILLDDSSRSFFGTKDIYKIWNVEILDVSLSVNDHFYVEDVITNQQYAILNRKSSTVVQPIMINEEFSTLLNKDNILEDFFYLAQNKAADDLLQAIIWLNKSRKSSDKKEKVISLYNCVEFLVTGERGSPLSQELSMLYGYEYDASISAIRKSVDEIQNEQLRERINGVINSSFDSNSSVHSKLQSLIESLPITFNDAEWDLFNKLKKNRQKLIHNKKNTVPITNQELNELFHLFSKLIIYKIIKLSNGGNND